MGKFAWIAGSGLILAAASAVGAGGSVPAGEWHNVNGDSNETGFSPLAEVTPANAARLGLAWQIELPGEATLQAAPVVVDGVLYFTGSYGAVYAVKGTTGQILWRFDPKIWEHNPMKMNFGFGANRGVAYANGKIFSAALDGRLFAIDAKTGAKLWEAETTDPKMGQTITGAPRTFRGKVIIGQGGADFGMRGYVSAWDQETGKQVWKFNVVPGGPEADAGDPVMEMAAKTWNGANFKKNGGGGGPWDSMTFDEELGRIYVGTANAYDYDPQLRSPGGGDNLFTASIVALDADTGKYAWHYQVNPRDSWDYDSTQQIMLTHLNIAGKDRRVLMQAPKNGFFYVIDRDSGKLISAEPIAKQNWAERIDLATGRPVEKPDIRHEKGRTTIYPSGVGAHSWMRMSYSPKTGLVYVPTMQHGFTFYKGKQEGDDMMVGGLGIGDAPVQPGDGKGTLVAWDPVTQKARWKVPNAGFFNGGTAVTAGNVVFQGGADGWFRAHDALTGKELWKHYVGMGIIAAPTVWSSGGKQYVSVLAGYGGSVAAIGGPAVAGWKYAMPRRLLTYAIGGKARIAHTPKPTMKVNVVQVPGEKLDPKAIAMGKNLWIACGACHGKGVTGTGGPAPDLRESGIPTDPDAFYTVLHDGVLKERGMPQFTLFGKPVVEGLRQYIRSEAQAELARQAAAKSKTKGKR
jgi:quinohemoprotein ethanol dehydrogenase